MSDLIRREDAIITLREQICGECNPGAKCDICHTDDLIRAVAEIPSADAGEIILCKDCKYYIPEEKYAGCVGKCHKYNRDFPMWDDGFCSMGEKKEERTYVEEP